MAKKSKDESFSQLLLGAIEEGLSCLGESAKNSTYFHIEELFKIKKQEISNRLSDFSNALEQIFGLGARYLEILIMKSLHAKLKTVLERDTSERVDPQTRFPEYVLFMKQNFAKAGKKDEEIEILVDTDEQQVTLHLRT